MQHPEVHALGLLAREHAAQVQRVDEAQVEVAIAVAGMQLDRQIVAARDRQRMSSRKSTSACSCTRRPPAAAARGRLFGLLSLQRRIASPLR